MVGFIKFTQKPKAQKTLFYPNRTGMRNEFISHGCGENSWECVNDYVDLVNFDSYIYSSSPSTRMSLFGLEVDEKEWTAINYVEFTYLLKSHQHPLAWDAEIKSVVTNPDYPTQGKFVSEEDFSLTTGYRTYKTRYFTNPFTGESWDWSDFDKIQMGLQGSSPSVSLFKYKFLPIADGYTDVEGVYPTTSEHWEAVRSYGHTSFVHESRPTYYTETFYVDIPPPQMVSYTSDVDSSNNWVNSENAVDGDGFTFASPEYVADTDPFCHLITANLAKPFDESSIIEIDSVSYRVRYRGKNIDYSLGEVKSDVKNDVYKYRVAIADKDFLYVATPQEQVTGETTYPIWKLLKINKQTKQVVAEIDVLNSDFSPNIFQRYAVGTHVRNEVTAVAQDDWYVWFGTRRGEVACVTKASWGVFRVTSPLGEGNRFIRKIILITPKARYTGNYLLILGSHRRIVVVPAYSLAWEITYFVGTSVTKCSDFDIKVVSDSSAETKYELYVNSRELPVHTVYKVNLSVTWSPGFVFSDESIIYSELSQHRNPTKIVYYSNFLYVVYNVANGDEVGEFIIIKLNLSGTHLATFSTGFYGKVDSTSAYGPQTNVLIPLRNGLICCFDVGEISSVALESEATLLRLDYDNLSVKESIVLPYTTYADPENYSGMVFSDYEYFISDGDLVSPGPGEPYIYMLGKRVNTEGFLLGSGNGALLDSPLPMSPINCSKLVVDSGCRTARLGARLHLFDIWGYAGWLQKEHEIVSSDVLLETISSNVHYSEWIDITMIMEGWCYDHGVDMVTAVNHVPILCDSQHVDVSMIELRIGGHYKTESIKSVTLYAVMGAPYGEEIEDAAYFYIIHPTHGTIGEPEESFNLKHPPKPFSKRFTTLPNSGNPWTFDDVGISTFGVRMKGGSEARLQHFYMTMETDSPFHPEIRCANMYMAVNHSPEEFSCDLNKPEEVSFNHIRNTKMLNFWSGNRAVYDHSRGGKNLVLRGKEFDMHIKGCSTQGDCVYPERRACERLQCIDKMGRDGEVVELSGFSFTPWNKQYRILSFGYTKIQSKPALYDYIIELEEVTPMSEEVR